MMQQEFKMNSEKKVYSKPLMEVVEMDYCTSLLDCSGCEVNDDAVDPDYEG
ncbi:hypothetical protein [Fibrobacter succinogenes]|uniref:hypothetical protein n=1 Tax=Fibrobacter succinogenes TaxID=833 RepID=UPI0013D1F9CE|nr:hypothetical protein [Fibrobacter succinogenes]